MARSRAYCGVGKKGGNSGGTATLEAHTQVRKIGRSVAGLVGSDEAAEGLFDGVGKHGEFRSALLLLKDDQRLVKRGIAMFDLLAENVNLSVLATQAEHGCAGHVGIVQISGNQAAE